jgi:predicted nucleic-acid-binding protein
VGRRRPRHTTVEGGLEALTAFVDTNILVRHLTGDPPDMARRATAFLGVTSDLLLSDLIVAETVYVLESYYETPRDQVAELIRSLIAFGSIVTVSPDLILRAIEIYEIDRLDFAEAYLVACAESTGVNVVASFDQAIDRIDTVTRIGP